MLSFTGTLPVSTASVYENDRDLYAVCWYRFRSNVFCSYTLASTVYILFGACDSSAQYVAGDCSVNTHNWDWCVTDELMEKCGSLTAPLKMDRSTTTEKPLNRPIVCYDLPINERITDPTYTGSSQIRILNLQ